MFIVETRYLGKGKGLHFVRTWEAMNLRCTPIVKNPFMKEEFEKMAPLVWVLDS